MMKHSITRSNKKKQNKTLKLNCHPNNKSKIHKDTCYTKEAILMIRDAFNKSHSDKIKSSSPKRIYNELRKRLTHCDKEDCWMNVIEDPAVRNQLDHILFAPDSPAEWKNNPTAWLSNYDIRDVLRQYEDTHPEFMLLGPTPINYDTRIEEGKCVWEELCRLSLKDLLARKKTKLGIVFNLDKHDEPGSHWTSLFVDSDEHKILYFDSAVNPCPKEVEQLISTICEQGAKLELPIKYDIIKNEYRHQTTNTECGMYSIFFNVTMITGKINKRIRTQIEGGGNHDGKKISMADKIRLFTTKGINDSMMKTFRKIYFNSNRQTKKKRGGRQATKEVRMVFENMHTSDKNYNIKVQVYSEDSIPQSALDFDALSDLMNSYMANVDEQLSILKDGPIGPPKKERIIKIHAKDKDTSKM